MCQLLRKPPGWEQVQTRRWGIELLFHTVDGEHTHPFRVFGGILLENLDLGSPDAGGGTVSSHEFKAQQFKAGVSKPGVMACLALELSPRSLSPTSGPRFRTDMSESCCMTRGAQRALSISGLVPPPEAWTSGLPA